VIWPTPLHFNSHFPDEAGLADTILILLELRMMEMVVTTGAIGRANLQSNRHHQQTKHPAIYRPDVLPVTQPCQSAEGKRVVIYSAIISSCTMQPLAIWLTLCVPAHSLHGRQQLRSTASGTLLVPRARTATGQRSFTINGPGTWNSLPADLRTPDTTLCSFKRHLKAHLFLQ